MVRGGGATKREGGARFTPTRRGGGGKSFSHSERGHKKFWGSSYVVARSFSHIVGGGGGA